MKVSITRIGNSRGIRLPKAVLEQTGLIDAADLRVVNGAIVLKPIARPPRENWTNAFGGEIELTEEDVEWLEAPLVVEDAWRPSGAVKSGSRPSTRPSARKSRRRGPA